MTQVRPTSPQPDPRPGASDSQSQREPGREPIRALTIVILSVTVVGGGALVAWTYPSQIREGWGSLTAGHRAAPEPRPGRTPDPAHRPWDGLVSLGERAREGMGISLTKVEPQSEPIRLELLGTTEYDTDTLTKVRPMFKGRVDKVHTTVGQAVKKGNPLIELYSTELAEAKGDYEVKRTQWLFEKTLVGLREKLIKTNAISQQLFIETRNDEMKNRTEYEVARDKLMVYGLSEAEVEKVVDEAGAQKARTTLRSPADGIVITRDVVVGNLYDDDDTLLVIAPLDHLWVWGNVFESDLDLVRTGQSWEIQFPFLTQKLSGKVEYISNRVDPGTHAVRVRTSIPNPEGRLKSDMLVRGMLVIPPAPGRTVIPRTALIVSDGRCYAFVRLAGETNVFERRSVGIAQEKDDHVVIDEGLKEGEEVVSIGGLLLNQLYEDRKTVQTEASPHDEPGADGRR